MSSAFDTVGAEISTLYTDTSNEVRAVVPSLLGNPWVWIGGGILLLVLIK